MIRGSHDDAARKAEGGGVMLTVISLGAGVQSTTLALMAAHGEITPMPDYAIMGDTQDEPKKVYEHLRWLSSPNVLPYPVITVTKGHLWRSATNVRTTRDGERKYIQTSIPVFTNIDDEHGHAQRHCTRDFKINPVTSQIRKLLGVKRIPAKSEPLVTVMIGISLDEAMRKKPSQKPWIVNRWPLLEKNMTRKDCLGWMEKHNYPTPPRSACTYCPYKSDNEWLALTPEEFADAVQKEKELQEAYAKTALRSTPYLHSSRVPLSEVKVVPGVEQERAYQIDLFNNECEGMCGI